MIDYTNFSNPFFLNISKNLINLILLESQSQLGYQIGKILEKRRIKSENIED